MIKMMKKQQQLTTTTAATMRSLTGGVCLLLLGLLVVAQVANSMSLVEQIDQSSSKPAVTLAVIENPELVSRVLESLLRSVIYSASVDVAGGMQQQRLDINGTERRPGKVQWFKAK